MNKLVLPLFIIFAASLACRTGNPDRKLNLYPSPSVEPSQTPFVQLITTTPVWTSTPVVIQVTVAPTSQSFLCVLAEEAVYLRPSPSTENYPITELENGTKVADMGGRSDGWYFVKVSDKQGWVNGSYLSTCNQSN